MAGRGTGVPITLKCSTCKKHHVTSFDGHDWYAHPGELWRTGRTRPRPTTNLVQRMTRTAHELWCSVCAEYMWSAHMDAASKPLIVKVDEDGKEI